MKLVPRDFYLASVVAIAALSGACAPAPDAASRAEPEHVDLCAGPLALSPDVRQAAQQALAAELPDPEQRALALRLLADDPAARAQAMPVVCRQPEAASPTHAAGGSYRALTEEAGWDWTSCTNWYLTGCYACLDETAPATWDRVACTLWSGGGVLTCGPRAGAYCTVRCIYSGCAPRT